MGYWQCRARHCSHCSCKCDQHSSSCNWNFNLWQLQNIEAGLHLQMEKLGLNVFPNFKAGSGSFSGRSSTVLSSLVAGMTCHHLWWFIAVSNRFSVAKSQKWCLSGCLVRLGMLSYLQSPYWQWCHVFPVPGWNISLRNGKYYSFNFHCLSFFLDGKKMTKCSTFSQSEYP